MGRILFWVWGDCLFYAPLNRLSRVHVVPEACLVFSIIFSSPACTPMDNYGCAWNWFKAKDGWLDTVEYALHAGGYGFYYHHLHQYFEAKFPSLTQLYFLVRLVIPFDRFRIRVIFDYCVGGRREFETAFALRDRKFLQWHHTKRSTITGIRMKMSCQTTSQRR